jgi:hypothetical protein
MKAWSIYMSNFSTWLYSINAWSPCNRMCFSIGPMIFFEIHLYYSILIIQNINIYLHHHYYYFSTNWVHLYKKNHQIDE